MVTGYVLGSMDPEQVGARLLAACSMIPDPEIPVITIGELGILRDVVAEADRVVVTITPTYSGCPAIDSIRDEIVKVLDGLGVEQVEVRTVYSPAWTTDWMEEEARRKLAAYGIAPPGERAEIVCPQCGSDETDIVSRFGSTACKALMVCETCGEPFDWFKRL
jgi:ring-1,2-phenylacetyl-CoA epoxidase subunit PaaD